MYRFSHSRYINRTFFASSEGQIFHRAVPRWDATGPTACPSLDECGEPRHDAGEETRGASTRKRGENGRQRGLFASECKPRLSALRSRARVCTYARTHACIVCVRRVCTRETPKEGSREVPPMPPSPSRETTPRRRGFACEYTSAERFAAHFPKERKDS